MSRLGILGWPVGHSRSPAIHAAAYDAAGLEGWRYQRLPVPPALLAGTVAALGAAGFLGANVTIPHKEAALAVADEATAEARAIGAANTLTFAGRIHAANTDAPGLLAALPVDPRGRTALVLGAGGSARAAVWALLDAGAAEVRIWNRTTERAVRLAGELGARVVETGPIPPADVLVNCTSVGLAPGESLAALPVDAGDVATFGCVVDLVYRRGGTPLVVAARAADVAVVDGLEVLVRQGALSFEAWTGRPAPLEAMRAAAYA